MRLLLSALALVALLAAGAAGWVTWRYNQRPYLAAWEERHELPPAPAKAAGPRVTVAFLGVATLLFSDGETALMTDGWFTRVSTWDLLRRTPVVPDADAITRGLARAGVTRLAAVMPVHSHYDHAQDAPEVARRTGALLLGSETTAWIGRGGGLPERQIRVVASGEPHRFGAFTVTFVRSQHVPLPFGGLLAESLDAPLVPPVPATAYPMGGAWSILIAHPLGSALVQGSAGWVPGALDAYRADTVLLGTGALARQGETYTQGYLREILDAVEARRVIPIHYDELTAPTDGALVPGNLLVDDVEDSFALLRDWAEAGSGRSLALLPYWQPAVLFGEGG